MFSMKWEWATTKDSYLYMGSMGKEYTNPDGSIANVGIYLFICLHVDVTITTVYCYERFCRLHPFFSFVNLIFT